MIDEKPYVIILESEDSRVQKIVNKMTFEEAAQSAYLFRHSHGLDWKIVLVGQIHAVKQ
jgi:hypothetical protein|tara:strand:+ start:3110 stop:3286 length:177 start_codon:yes stop_codon:yes gene_type:complete